jgi:hypothetical protein
MILANSTKVILDGTGDWSNLAEPTSIASSTYTPVAVDTILTCCTILADV